VLQAMPFYPFLVMVVPPKVIETIKGLQRDFLWGGSNHEKNGHWLPGTRYTSLSTLEG
jgi:hypothetical protein